MRTWFVATMVIFALSCNSAFASCYILYDNKTGVIRYSDDHAPLDLSFPPSSQEYRNAVKSGLRLLINPKSSCFGGWVPLPEKIGSQVKSPAKLTEASTQTTSTESPNNELARQGIRDRATSELDRALSKPNE